MACCVTSIFKFLEDTTPCSGFNPALAVRGSEAYEVSQVDGILAQLSDCFELHTALATLRHILTFLPIFPGEVDG